MRASAIALVVMNRSNIKDTRSIVFVVSLNGILEYLHESLSSSNLA